MVEKVLLTFNFQKILQNNSFASYSGEDLEKRKVKNNLQ